jgi:uncharacterized membrane protein YiaA
MNLQKTYGSVNLPKENLHRMNLAGWPTRKVKFVFLLQIYFKTKMLNIQHYFFPVIVFRSFKVIVQRVLRGVKL